MKMERKATRYAHSDGHTDVCYTEDGKRLITCGTDGDVRIYTEFDDDDPIQTCVGEWALCVRQKGERLYIATDKNNVQITKYPEAERDGILIRFTAHVNHMATGKNHDFIAVASEDMEVKVINLSKDSEVFSFTGLSGPPLSVALNPKGRMLAVASGDGMLRIWNVEDSTVLKEIDCVPKINSFINAKCLTRIHFDPITGRTLAYPNNNSVIIIDTISWSERLIFMCPEVEASYSIAQFSPCGELMAGATQQGDIIIWDVATQTVIGITKHPKSIAVCSLEWNPIGNGEIAFCDVQGQLGLVVNCIKPTADVIEAGDTDHNEELSGNDVDFGDLVFDDGDEDGENVISLEKLKRDVMGDNSESESDKVSFHAPTPRPRTPETPLQNAFMPTSTPEHLNPRYLCWNEVGIVRKFGSDVDDDSIKSIEVEFHDSNLHNSMMIQNFHGYTMGSLSTSALAIAHSHLVAVIPLSAGTKEWNINMAEDQGEEILCIACSENLVCLGTSNMFIRVHSVYGTQKSVLSVPGPLVCMSARGNMLLSAYHASAPRNGDQCLNVMLTKLEGMAVENKELNSALRPETTLLWLGFSDLDTPAMQDSSGLLSLYPETCNIWLPVCDTKKKCSNPSDGFFITAVFESFQSIRGIRCRGSVYPSFIPRPTLAELSLEPPFIEMDTEKSQLEANLSMWSLLRVADVEKKIKETALKTFALACRSNLDQRALELIGMLSNPQLVTLATKYATKLNRRRLAEKLMEMATTLQNSEYEESSFNASVVSNSSDIKPINKKLILNSSTKRIPNKSNSENDQASSSRIEVASAPECPTSLNIEDKNISTIQNCSTADISLDLNTSHSKPANPFAKSSKMNQSSGNNPLSLTDKFAGISEEAKVLKENKTSFLNINSEKRKQPESETEKPKDKQRKLNKFLFTKRS